MSWQALVLNVAEDLLKYSQDVSISLPDAQFMSLQSARLVKIIEDSRVNKDK